MNNKQFYSVLKETLNATRANLYYLTKIQAAKYDDMTAFCDRHISAEMNPEGRAPKNRLEMMEQLLEGAGTNEQYNGQKWESYVRGCGHVAFTPDADAIRDHYFTAEQIEKWSLSWNNYPPRVKDWQDYEARRLHAAAETLCELAFVLSLFN